MSASTTPPSSGLLAACDDSRLINFPLWPAQRELLAAVEAGPRLHVWALGRRSGKTTMAALVAVHDCLFRPDLARFLRPREKRYSVAVATSQKQATIFLDAARAIVEHSPLLAKLIASISDDEIVFENRTVIRALPATARGVRGLPVSSLLLDECAHMLDGDGNACAEPMWRSLAPSLAQFGEHGRGLIASTPFGTGGWFAETFARAQAGEIDDAVAANLTSAQVNPTLDADFLRSELERDPEGFRGEYLAEFLASGGSYIDAARLRDCVVDRGELDRLDATNWKLGLDVGFASDPTGVALIGRDSLDEGRLRVGLVRKFAPQKSATFEQRRAIEDTLLDDVIEIARYFDASAVCDQYLAPLVAARLARARVRVETLALTATSKSLAFNELRARINARTIDLPDEPELLADLRGLRSQFRAGSASVVTPRTSRGHSDVAVAMALATWSFRNAHGATAVAAWGHERPLTATERFAEQDNELSSHWSNAVSM